VFFASLLRRLTTNGLRKGLSGSTPWMIIGTLAAGFRVMQHLARHDQEVLYRTAIKAGDVFEIISGPKP
jgi:hypothetical protein